MRTQAMKKLIVTAIACVFAVVASSAQAEPAPSEQDIGSCYSLRPICTMGSPVCMCDYSMNCFWACR